MEIGLEVLLELPRHRGLGGWGENEVEALAATIIILYSFVATLRLGKRCRCREVLGWAEDIGQWLLGRSRSGH